jgi:hypothetical protein
MFGDQKVNGVSGNSEQNSFSTPTATHNEDMFSMFSNDTPSSSPETYSSPSSTISSAGISVQDLLRDVQDSDDETLIEKKDQDFFQLMHY